MSLMGIDSTGPDEFGRDSDSYCLMAPNSCLMFTSLFYLIGRRKEQRVTKAGKDDFPSLLTKGNLTHGHAQPHGRLGSIVFILGG